MTFFIKENHPLCFSPIRGRLSCFLCWAISETYNFLKLYEFIHPLCFCLGLLAVHSANIRFCFAFSKQVSSLALFTGTCFAHYVLCTLAKIRCLGFAPRSQSFTFGLRPVRSICSLSELVTPLPLTKQFTGLFCSAECKSAPPSRGDFIFMDFLALMTNT